jgi:hypothetical protein
MSRGSAGDLDATLSLTGLLVPRPVRETGEADARMTVNSEWLPVGFDRSNELPKIA